MLVCHGNIPEELPQPQAPSWPSKYRCDLLSRGLGKDEGIGKDAYCCSGLQAQSGRNGSEEGKDVAELHDDLLEVFEEVLVESAEGSLMWVFKRWATVLLLKTHLYIALSSILVQGMGMSVIEVMNEQPNEGMAAVIGALHITSILPSTSS